ncbi:MAG: class 1 fructose-bisphosphatase [Natronomonas sp.]
MTESSEGDVDSIEAIFDVVASTATDVRAGLVGRRVYESAENPSGETQLAADVYADELLESRLFELDIVGEYASEEREEVSAGDGRFHVAADPLDGSSNLRSNNAMGTIVGIYEEPAPAPGDALVAATFVLYGPITTMVTARDGRVTEFVIDENGHRDVVTEDLTLPDDPTVFGFGGRVPKWPDAFAEYVETVEAELKLRYGGAMIADVNQVLTYGGIFGYPSLLDRPEGKLRLQFEGHPIGYIVESAGGASSNGTRSLLECDPDTLHERTPVFVGNDEYIERLEDTL